MARRRADRPEAKSRRLFVAIEIDEAAQDAIDAVIEPWRARLPKARWSPRANRHVTVRFLGPVWPRLVAAVTDATAATAAEAAPFELALGGTGRFPARGSARVLWIGLQDRAGALAALAADLQDRLPDEIEPERRPFAAHLTVARSNPPLDMPATWAGTAVEPHTWRAAHLTLFESHLQRPHARYEPLARFDLGHVAGPPADPR